MISKLYTEYCDWIANNPVEAADCESVVKWGSLLFAGRTKSTLIPELLFTTSNLITLHNDTVILRKYDKLKDGSKIKIWLSILEYSETFLELGLSRFGGNKKLILIYAIQLVKCIARLYLLHVNKCGLIAYPPLVPVERLTFKNNQKLAEASGSISQVIKERRKSKKAEEVFTNEKYLAEIIFTLKPLSHLNAKLLFGNYSWKPYILSLLMDAWSLTLLTKNYKQKKLNSNETFILSQRFIRLLLYFLRSPFYDIHFKSIMILMFNQVFKNVPFTKSVLKPLLHYILKVQNIYFYMWSS